jgi:DNA helicase-2/ATP-dependent DNA helicase PcrA
MAQKLKAQKEAPKYTAPTQGFHSTNFSVGDKVLHDKFGVGTINSIVNIGNSTLYRVEFEKYGIKAVDAEFNKMTLAN